MNIIKSHKERSSQTGFTIVELMIAMTVFSLILVASAAGLIQISRLYYKSAITTRTQDNTRSIITELSRSVQFSGSTPAINNTGIDYGGLTVKSVCIGSLRYSFALDRQVGSNPPSNALWRDNNADAGCTPLDVGDSSVLSSSGGVELLGENSRLTKLDISSPRPREYRIQISVAYGDSDLLVGLDSGGNDAADPADITRFICNPSGPGTQFCAVVDLETLVSRRL